MATAMTRSWTTISSVDVPAELARRTGATDGYER